MMTNFSQKCWEARAFACPSFVRSIKQKLQGGWEQLDEEHGAQHGPLLHTHRKFLCIVIAFLFGALLAMLFFALLLHPSDLPPSSAINALGASTWDLHRDTQFWGPEALPIMRSDELGTCQDTCVRDMYCHGLSYQHREMLCRFYGEADYDIYRLTSSLEGQTPGVDLYILWRSH